MYICLCAQGPPREGWKEAVLITNINCDSEDVIDANKLTFIFFTHSVSRCLHTLVHNSKSVRYDSGLIECDAVVEKVVPDVMKGSWCLHFQRSSIIFQITALHYLETPGMTRPTTQRYIPYDQIHACS
jgi:hypothetical protein